MGNSFSVSGLLASLSAFFFGCERRVLLVGLDAAGKTTLLDRLKLGETSETTPTVGFNVETVSFENVRFTMFDMGGQWKVRPLWIRYVYGSHAIVFVVDSADPERLSEARESLVRLYDFEDSQNAKLLVFANKQDVPGALSPDEIRDRMELDGVTKNLIYVQGCTAITGDGLYEGLEWLARTVTETQTSQSDVNAI